MVLYYYLDFIHSMIQGIKTQYFPSNLILLFRDYTFQRILLIIAMLIHIFIYRSNQDFI